MKIGFLPSYLQRLRADETTQEIQDELRRLAEWIRTPGNINPDDAIDEIARVLENRVRRLRSRDQQIRTQARVL